MILKKKKSLVSQGERGHTTRFCQNALRLCAQNRWFGFSFIFPLSIIFTFFCFIIFEFMVFALIFLECLTIKRYWFCCLIIIFFNCFIFRRLIYFYSWSQVTRITVISILQLILIIIFIIKNLSSNFILRVFFILFWYLFHLLPLSFSLSWRTFAPVNWNNFFVYVIKFSTHVTLRFLYIILFISLIIFATYCCFEGYLNFL